MKLATVESCEKVQGVWIKCVDRPILSISTQMDLALVEVNYIHIDDSREKSNVKDKLPKKTSTMHAARSTCCTGKVTLVTPEK